MVPNNAFSIQRWVFIKKFHFKNDLRFNNGDDLREGWTQTKTIYFTLI